ncbi:sigma-54-dependent transcriptional regulator [Thiohalorhabdus sp. Cl-TMA]|uniref:Sigma-54-dependent transcriptional regulator n=1 Tax=Thiohalorhabdus methylotrophus TaxID=3242694 RepID=A0ABV4TW81_9GAMM
MSERLPILVVDDERRALETIRRLLEEEFAVHVAEDASTARGILESVPVQVILCDQRMPDISGVELLKEVRERWPSTIRMIISAYTDSEDIITGVNEAGIYQYITKPWHPDSLLLTVRGAAQLYQLQRENDRLTGELRFTPGQVQGRVEGKRARVRQEYALDRIIRCPDSRLNSVCDQIVRVAPYNISVLLTGESGTGKELFARAIHYNSPRADAPFLAENCGALPDELLESELFGHRKGAFTGAIENRMGLFEQADGGTILLDEVGDITPALQVKLLRVLQEGEIRPLGSTERRRVDCRIIAATNKDLEEEVRAGRFREDLYFRLATLPVPIPALRERTEDIPVLARYILEEVCEALERPVEGFTEEAVACMQSYGWPGNVRELQNEIQRMVVMAEDPWLGADLLSPRILRNLSEEPRPRELEDVAEQGGTLQDRLEALEARVLRETLIRNRWNKTRAAQELGLSRVGLRGKLERHGLEPTKATGE